MAAAASWVKVPPRSSSAVMEWHFPFSMEFWPLWIQAALSQREEEENKNAAGFFLFFLTK